MKKRNWKLFSLWICSTWSENWSRGSAGRLSNNTQIDTFNFNSVLFHLCIYLCFILLDGTAVIEAESENHPPASVMRQWCRGRRQNGRGKLRKVRVWLSEGWTGPFFSKQEAASLCLERRGISLRKTQMRSLVGTDTRDGGGKLWLQRDVQQTLRHTHIVNKLLTSTAGVSGRSD